MTSPLIHVQDERINAVEGTPDTGDPAGALVLAAITDGDCEQAAWALGEARALDGVTLRETVSELTDIALGLPRRSQRRLYLAVEALVDGWFGGIDEDTGYLDPLTGLPNGAFFSVRLSQLVSRDGPDAWATMTMAVTRDGSMTTIGRKVRLASLASSWFTDTDTVAIARSGELLVLARRHDELVDEVLELEQAAESLVDAEIEVTILPPRGRALAPKQCTRLGVRP